MHTEEATVGCGLSKEDLPPGFGHCEGLKFRAQDIRSVLIHAASK